ncbi:MAG: ergothioneine biosynthesis protein EgtB [Acidobacteria bacterium]|nr:MAG: ergothioneine biosynthesis protein EgtB [Acidobacteriota bacterium]
MGGSISAPFPAGPAEGHATPERYPAVRLASEALVAPLSAEDCAIQSMPDCSPTRWHLAHTSWFFETFVLAKAEHRFRCFDPVFALLFNSYYNAVGEQFPRERRGVLSRPGLQEVLRYRRDVDLRMERLLASGADPELLAVVELGLNHEQQHQELILTDIKHVFSCNPLHPAYRAARGSERHPAAPLSWASFTEGTCEIGHAGGAFAFDNESPRHRVFLESFLLATRLTTNAEYLQFMQDGGYACPEHWLSAGWQQARAAAWRAPLYWLERDGAWWNFTLSGLHPVEPAEPVCHVSYFEADAFARWAGARLPTEAEWEAAAAQVRIEGNFVESGALHPEAARGGRSAGAPSQMFGDVWEWTSSSYAPYPGYRPAAGALGEYNGKFMCNQYVLRGGSCATPQDHMRATYRNFFPPDARWQFSGIRLAR